MTSGLEKFIEYAVRGWIGRVIVAAAAVLATARYGAGFYFYKQTEKLERPKYTVLRELPNGVELRQYEPYLIAETTVDGTGFREPTAQGFQACAGYIFGKNKGPKEAEKMAMTAPVRVTGGDSSSKEPSGEKMAMTAPVRVDGNKKKTKVSFVMGSKYTLKTLPTPLDKKVKLRQVPAHTLAVRTFSGPPPKDDRVAAEREKVEEALRKENMKPKSDETLVYGYHDPFITPNFLRRNEVALLVEGRL
jgi:hypothetical protein